MSKPSITVWVALVVALLFSGNASAQETKPKVPKSKQTPLELYVTASEAYARIAAKPDATLLIDVRTPEEYLFVGHAPMAHNIPLYFQSYQWDAIRGRQVMKPNPDFLRDLRAKVQKDTTKEVFVMCRSGGRSARAIRAMADAGFEKVWNITDGFEGAMVKDRKHPNFGQRLVNGWKNSKAPWTYTLNEDRAYRPSSRAQSPSDKRALYRALAAEADMDHLYQSLFQKTSNPTLREAFKQLQESSKLRVKSLERLLGQ